MVLVTIDTLRADHVSCYGYARNTTPFIDRIAARGLVYRNAYATSSWTAPSMASIFTGLYPRQHGVRHGFVQKGERAIAEQEFLWSGFPLLAEAMREAGYETFGLSSNGHMAPNTGFARGFDHFEAMWFVDAPAVNAAAEKWKDRIAAAGKYFLWVHYFDPHAPFVAREPYIREYAADAAAWEPWTGLGVDELERRKLEIRRTEGALQALVDLYDSEIRYCDRFVEQLFELLGIDERALVIVTSDHGEEFLEHNNIGHGHTLFEETIRVPLIVQWPGGTRTGTVDRLVGNKDVFATILDMLEVRPAAPAPGRSLFAETEGEDAARVFTELDRGRQLRAVREGDWKLIAAEKKPRSWLYDLSSDPGERADVAAAAPERAALLRSLLDGFAAEPAFAAPKSQRRMDPEAEMKLRSLGYLR